MFRLVPCLKRNPLVLGLFLACAVGFRANATPAVEGKWLTEGKSAIVEIFRCGSDDLCGRLVWFRIGANDPNPQGLDLKNPDPRRRNQPLCGSTFMQGFRPGDPNSWEDGRIYDPESGNTYNATMKLRPDGTLDLHGYIGISLIGRSEIWTRDPQPVPACPTR
jgi:uncharacterized protein (DUF2147 family)